MKVIFTCGGTGGHIYPAIAVAKLLKSRRPDCEILFLGAQGGMECDLVRREGFRLETLRISGYERSLSPSAIVHNLKSAVYTQSSVRKAGKLIDGFRPDVIVGTGGYASYPALKAGALRGVPTVVHESNAAPGLTTRLVEKDVSRVMVGCEESRSAYSHPERVCVVGTPVREAFLYTERAQARAALGVDGRPLIVSFWGSLGAREMNKMIADFFLLEKQAGYPWKHVHACGAYGWSWMPDFVREKGLELSGQNAVDMREFIFDMPQVMAAADLVICRAGAATLAEVAASGTPAIVIPSPNVAENHQEKNARIPESRGAAVVLHESECSAKLLFETVQSVLNDGDRRASMRRAAQSLAVVDSAERIYQTVLELSKAR